jgi:hypothetical protein
MPPRVADRVVVSGINRFLVGLVRGVDVFAHCSQVGLRSSTRGMTAEMASPYTLSL